MRKIGWSQGDGARPGAATGGRIVQTLVGYFVEQGLFADGRLVETCTRHGVRIARSDRFPHLRLLEYGARVQIGKIPWDAFNRRCRGVVVDMERKRILAYPFGKFFNLGEKAETEYERLVELGPFTGTEKMDGSMGILFRDEATGHFHITTRGSFDSPQALWASQRIPASVQDRELVDKHTLIFEIIAYRERGIDNIIDYEKKGRPEGLYLVGARHKISEKLLPHGEVFALARERDLPTPQVHAFDTIDACVETAKRLPWMEEGFVLEFRDGTLVKVKSPEYLRVHRFVSGYNERRVLEALRDGKAPSLLEAVPEEYRAAVEEDLDRWRRRALDLVNRVYEHLGRAPKDDKKTLALWAKANVSSDDLPFLFRARDGRLRVEDVYAHFLKRLELDSDRAGLRNLFSRTSAVSPALCSADDEGKNHGARASSRSAGNEHG